MQAIAIYFATLVVACAVNIQYRNAINGNYVAIGLTSCFIGTLNLFMLKTIPHVTHFYEGLAYILGGATGAVAANFLHKRFFNK
jgi:4-hydroxybenzoate polyprenyltransferase